MKIAAVLAMVVVCLGASSFARAQIKPSVQADQPPSYVVNLTSRTTPAMNYGHRGGSTKIDFRGTNLMPSANGVATIETKSGATKISAEFESFQKPTSFGNEYLTYVLWAISPEGRQVNLGEVLVGNNHRSKLAVTTDLQSFALIVTAEPYYAVRRPSNVVVSENALRPDTVGTSEAVDAKYELIERGGYIPTGYTFDPVVLNAKLPLEFFEGRNAMRIAKAAGAADYATSSYDNAVSQMKRADDLGTSKHIDKKALISVSREVVQTADDAREIAVKRMDADRLNSERDASAAKLADAAARSQADSQARANADIAAAEADRERNQANQAASAAQQQTLDAQAESQRNLAAAANANQATADAQQARKDAEAESERSRIAASASDQQLQQAVRDREELRARLLAQFNAVLSTTDTARGLVVNLSDVLFDTGKYTLRPLAREKLAKISGIVLAYPDLKLAIEGNTDSVGTDVMNQELSEKRAGSVMNYLAQQNIPAASMTAKGFGKSQPVASNDTAEGRQENRRVELVVSGDVIGTSVGAISQNLPVDLRP